MTYDGSDIYLGGRVLVLLLTDAIIEESIFQQSPFVFVTATIQLEWQPLM